VQTLLFTDIVGSTDRLRDLGDAAWAGLLVRYHGVIRAALAAHGGREVDTAGDGFLARFDAPAAAVRAAVAVLAAVAALPIEIRAGLHTGEVELDGDAVTGVGVHLAARVMGQAGQCHGPRAHGWKRAGVRRPGSARAQGVPRALAAVRP
jgi:class 3 adenylate cyclase